jgi:O-antigen ligase
MPIAHRILDRVIFVGLLMTIVLTAIPYGSVQPWWVALFECVIFVFGILGLIDLMITKERLPAAASVALPLVILCLFLLFQSLPLFSSNNAVIPNLRLSISADPYTTQLLALKLFALIVAGVLLLRYANTESRLRMVVYVVIGVGVGSAILGLLRQGGSGSPSWLFPLPKDSRGFAQFVNRNHFALLLEMSLGLTLGVLVGSVRSYLRLVVFIAVAFFLWMTLIISNSRGGIFASLCQLLFLVLLLNPFRRLRRESVTKWDRFRNFAGGVAMKVILIVSLIIVFAYGVSWVGGESVVTNFELSSYSFSQAGAQGHRENISRKDIWTATWQLIKARPVFGAGFGAYWIAITKYHNASGSYSPQEAHNDYLELLASGGLVGFALVAWFGVRFVKITHTVLRGADGGFVRQAALGATLGIFGALIHSFVDFGLHITINSVIFSILLAVPIACYRMAPSSTKRIGLAERATLKSISH